jgi:glycosyltransferase involved in cell wall biosynthesis
LAVLQTPVANGLRIALLTGGGDRPYALGMAAALNAQGIHLDFIGSNDVNGPELHGNPLVKFLNLRGDQRTNVSSFRKLLRVLVYYGKLIRYAATAKPKIFHLLWNNKFEFFDRTVLMLYYRLLGKRLVLTVHNVNAGKRDGNDSWLNRFSLGIQYRLAQHLFVHTEMMRRELAADFAVPQSKVSVIPFGINNTVPNTTLTGREARARLGLADGEKVILFFGGITPYKGLEYALRALAKLVNPQSSILHPPSSATAGVRCPDVPQSSIVNPPSSAPPAPPYRLLIAGKPKGDSAYWPSIEREISAHGLGGRVLVRSEFIPDEETEVYFKAADVLVLPYTHVFQSGVLFLGYSFGLPVVAADVGSLKEEIVAGITGYVFPPRDAGALAGSLAAYFASDLCHQLEVRRAEIKAYANERYSWTKVGRITTDAYTKLVSR